MHTVYRGDYTKIDEFKYNKTDKNCLFGRGIYLTDSKSVAESYRTKGSYHDGADSKVEFLIGSSRPNPLKPGVIGCRTKEEAFFAAEDLWVSNVMGYLGDNKKYLNKLHEDYKILLSEREVKITKHLPPYGSDKAPSWTVDFTPNIDTPKDGYISVFEFPNNYLDANTINTINVYSQIDFLRMVFDKGFLSTHYPEPNISFDYFRTLFANCDLTSVSQYLIGFDKTPPIWRALKKSLSQDSSMKRLLVDYGIIGVHYNGGVLTGSRRHNAYCIWDEEDVNKYFTSQYR